MGSRGFSGHSKSLPEGSQHAFEAKMCSEWSLGRVWDTFGTPFGRPFGKEKRSRNDSEQIFIHNQVETSLSKGLERILKRFMAWFYTVCRCDRTHENNDTATLRIFKNTCVFIVRLHIHVVEEARLKTKINMFYGARWRKPSEVVSGPPQNLDLEAIWGSKTMPNPVQNAFTMKFNIAWISEVKKGVEEHLGSR